ncbi:MAG: SH3 domain-containing protein [Rhizobiaceae bacterium]|nr:SH3 domain-containing protein [Rhizobiaceae bacterium]
MRTITALFGLGLVLAALVIGWWAPVDETPPPQLAVTRPVPEDMVASVEPAEEPAVPPASEPAEPDPIESAATGEDDRDVFYTSANVRMRSGPSSNFAIVWTAPAGTEVRSLQIDGNWHFVTTAEHEGWIYNRYLSPEPTG